MSRERTASREWQAMAYSAGLDGDTVQYGIEPPFEDWEDDSTGFVHILWSARRRGLTLEKNADEIASMVMRSRWLAAVKAKSATTTTTKESN